MAIMGTHGIKLEKLADMRKYCKPQFISPPIEVGVFLLTA